MLDHVSSPCFTSSLKCQVDAKLFVPCQVTMICFVPFIVASVTVTVAARHYLEYDSIRTLEPQDLLGCRVIGTEVIYNCSDQQPSDSPRAPRSPVLRFRVDCREAQGGKFQKLRIFDEAGVCGAMDYTKYTGDTSDPIELQTISWIPDVVQPRTYSSFSVKEGDFFDIQCVLMPLQEVTIIKNTTDSNSYKRWLFDFQFIKDGSQAKDNRGSFRVFELQTPVLFGGLEQHCESDLEHLNHWMVSSHSELNSSENSHWIDVASPQFFDDPSYLPPVDIPVVRSGEFFRVSAPSLHLFVHSLGYSTNVAHLNPMTGDCEMEKQILFHKRIDVDASQLPVGTQKIRVSVHVSWRFNNPFRAELFTIELPVFNAGVKPSTTTTVKPEEPAKNDTTPKPEEPAKDDTTPQPEEPAKDDTTPKPEEPAKDDTTPQPEEPAKDDTTPQPEEPAKDDTTPKPEEPAKDDTTPKPEEPAKDDPTAKPEEPAKDDPTVTPDKQADDSKSKSSGSWFFWPLTIFIVLALVAAMAYVYRERLGFTPARAVRTSTGAAIEMRVA